MCLPIQIHFQQASSSRTAEKKRTEKKSLRNGSSETALAENSREKRRKKIIKMFFSLRLCDIQQNREAQRIYVYIMAIIYMLPRIERTRIHRVDGNGRDVKENHWMK
jgi:hypothetical protein